MSSPIVVSDTTCLMMFAKLGAIQILFRLYGQVQIPCTVFNELTVSHHQDIVSTVIAHQSWIKVHAVRNHALAATLQQGLDRGEAEAIALAIELDADLLLIDERKGRREAKIRGLQIRGIIGTLLRAKERRIIRTVEPIIDSMLRIGARFSKQLVQEALAQAGEPAQGKATISLVS